MLWRGAPYSYKQVLQETSFYRWQWIQSINYDHHIKGEKRILIGIQIPVCEKTEINEKGQNPFSPAGGFYKVSLDKRHLFQRTFSS
jgi:hypothetical protein